MSNYFTYLWKNEQWRQKCNATDGGPLLLEYAAGDKFKSNGVTKGSTVFIVTVIEGDLYLGGAIVVSEVLDKPQAMVRLGIPEQSLWKAAEYIVSERGKVTSFTCSNMIPPEVSHRLEFVEGAGFRNPVVRQGKLDGQTFRNVRTLYPGSETALLDRLVA